MMQKNLGDKEHGTPKKCHATSLKPQSGNRCRHSTYTTRSAGSTTKNAERDSNEGAIAQS
jgi:hypothetical protein